MLTQVYNGQYDYRLFLCSPNKTIINELEYKNIQYTPYLSDFDELNFSIDYYQNGLITVKNAKYDIVNGLYFILMNIVEGDTVIKEQYFCIVEPTDSFSNGQIQKTLKCISSEYILFGRKKLRGYKSDSQLLYDTSGNNGILNYIIDNIFLGSWSIGYFNSDFEEVYHIFEFTDNTLIDVFKKLEHDFNCIFRFNNVNNTINVYNKTEIGNNYGLVISTDNFLNDISYTPKFDQIITRLYVVGKNNTTISQYNKTGKPYIDNFDWFINNGYFSDTLKTKWETYSTLVNSYTGDFNNAISELNTYQSDLIVLTSELASLNTQKKIIEDNMDVIKRANLKNNATYDNLYLDLQTIMDDIALKETNISTKEGQIENVQNYITDIVNILAYTNPSNFSDDDLKELVNFIYEDTLQIDTVSDPELLYQYGLEYVSVKSQPIYEVNVDIVDILSADDTYMIRDKLNIGDFAYINVQDIGFDNQELQIVSYSHNKSNHKLSIKFSNTSKIEDSLYNLNDIFRKANQASIDLNQNKDTFSEYASDKGRLIYNDALIDASDNGILAGSNYINRRGFLGNELGGYGQIQILDDRIIFSKDSWETFFTLLSAAGLHLENLFANSRVMITPENGFQIDQWNESISDWRNVVYIGTNGEFCIDNGYVQLQKIYDSVPTNQIIIDPDVGFKIQKNITPSSTPTWFDVLLIDNEGDVRLADENGNGTILDQFGLDTKFIKWFKNMEYNTGFEIYDEDYMPHYWDGGVSTQSSSFFGSRSLMLVPTETSMRIMRGSKGLVNPQWYDDISHKTRVSFHKKGGKVRISVLDASNDFTPFTLTDENGNTGSYIEYAYNANWVPESYTVSFEHGSATDIRVKFENSDSVENAYIDGVITEPDYTGKRPSFYTEGMDSVTIGENGVSIIEYPSTVHGNLYVQPEIPEEADENSVWVDTDDPTIDDGTTTTTLTWASPRQVNATSNVTLPNPASAKAIEGSTAHSGVVMFCIRNANTDNGVISVGYDSFTVYLFPQQSVTVRCIGTAWEVV